MFFSFHKVHLKLMKIYFFIIQLFQKNIICLLIIISTFSSFSQNGQTQETDNGKIILERECGLTLIPLSWKSCEEKKKDNGHISVSGNSNIEIIQFPGGTTSFKIIPNERSPNKRRSTINLKQIPIVYQLNNTETSIHANVKITQVDESLDIYVGALHAFKYD